MKKLFVAAVALLPFIAFAHPGHDSGFIAAFEHPFTGIDHLLMMLCVGILAGRIGGNMRWQLPLAFLCSMTIGWIVASAEFFVAGIESGIAAGLIALGVLFVWRIAVPRPLHVAAISLFSLLHGMAHGAELSGATPLLTSIGFLAATALLHVLGVAIAALIPSEKQNAYRALGIFLSAIGGGLLLAA